MDDHLDDRKELPTIEESSKAVEAEAELAAAAKKEIHELKTRAQLEGDITGLNSELKKAIDESNFSIPQNCSSLSTKRID